MFPSSERLSPKTMTWVKASADVLTRNGSVRKTLTIKFLIPIIIPFTKNGIALCFGCNHCISQSPKKIEFMFTFLARIDTAIIEGPRAVVAQTFGRCEAHAQLPVN